MHHAPVVLAFLVCVVGLWSNLCGKSTGEESLIFLLGDGGRELNSVPGVVRKG